MKYIKGSKNKIIGYQGLATNVHNKHHNFCRLSPRDNYFYEWNKLDQLTKIKWYWDTIYKNIFLDLKKMPNRDYKIVKIEDIDYEKYKDIAKWIGVKTTLNKLHELTIRRTRTYAPTDAARARSTAAQCLNPASIALPSPR